MTGPEDAEAVVAEIRKSGTDALALKADVSNEDDVVSMFRTAVERFGRLDISSPIPECSGTRILST